MNPNMKTLRKKAMGLPLLPGVYLMKDASGKVIYVGKAKALKNRVSQYFGSQNNHTTKVRKMVEHVSDFDYVVVGSEFEALVLECSLIKQYNPKYNILLKDDKGYHYIKITEEAWPRLSAVKQQLEDGATYIGPYLSSYCVTQAVDEAKKIFKLPQCNKQFPRDFKKGRPCLNYSIGQCAAPCTGKITREDYCRSVQEAVDFLKNGSEPVVADLQRRMEAAAEHLEFEKAAALRDKIRAIARVTQTQRVVANDIKKADFFALVSEHEQACFAVLRFENGRLYDSEHFFLEHPEDGSQARAELLQRFYSMRSNVPPLVAVDSEVEDSDLLADWLTSLAGRKVTIHIPKRGEQVRLMEMCKKNASEKLAHRLGRSGKAVAALQELTDLLGLKAVPKYIEAYDISHTAGSENVAGMVVFRDGQPCKSMYKRFAIRSFDGQNDVGSMREVMTRRLQRYWEEKDTGEGFGILPDLILLDGGAPQLNAVAPILAEFQVDVPIFGMVKDSHHRTRAITAAGGELSMTSRRGAFALVGTIQEEVHRFAIAYHHQKHAKAGLTSGLLQIPGIGEARAKALLKHFKTMKAIREADVDALCSVKGMSRPAAEVLYNALHPET